MNIKTIKDLMRGLRARALRTRMRRRPELPLPEGRVLVVAPHPDDETLGCGGLIARLCDAGRPPQVLILSRGEGSHSSCCDLSADVIGTARHRLTLDSAEILGLPTENIRSLDLPDGGVPGAVDAVPKALTDFVEALDPEVVFVPHWGEGWPDHVNARKLFMELAATRPGTEVYEYCVWMWYYMARGLDWRNGFVMRMDEGEFARKRAASLAYVTPLAPCGRPWSGVLPRPLLRAAIRPAELYFALPPTTPS